MKKRFLVGFAIVASILIGFHKQIAAVAGVELVSPTVYCHITQDNSGNMNFMDATAGPLTLAQLQGQSGFTMSSGNFQNGSATAAVSTATATLGQGNVFTAFLASGTLVAVQGSVLIATTTQNNLLTVQVAPASNSLTNVIGVAVVAASTGGIVNVYSNGWVLALTTQTVNPGDVLVSTAGAAGFLAANNSAGANAQVGIALQTGNTNGGLIKIKLK